MISSPFKLAKFLYHNIKESLQSFSARLQLFSSQGIYLPRGCIISRLENISIGKGFSCGNNCQLLAQDKDSTSKLVIADNVKLNSGVMLNADKGGSILIGENVLIGPNTTLRAANHIFSDKNIPIIKQGHSAGKIIIKKNAWLGANVTVLPSVTIGEGAIIAAGSVVNKSVPDFQIFGGIPAKYLKTRN